MEVGKHRALLCAESDAIDSDGSAVEVKASSPRYWGTKVPLQMISNGSSKLVYGEKYWGGHVRVLHNVQKMSLREVIQRECPASVLAGVEGSILEALDAIKRFAKEGRLEEGKANFKLCFEEDGLAPQPLSKTIYLTPPCGVVEELFGKKECKD